METNNQAEEQEPVVEPTSEAKVESTSEVLKHPEMKTLLSSFETDSDEPEVEEVEAESGEEPEGEQAEVEPETEPEAESWVLDRDRRYAATLGLTEDALADFGSRDELEKFGRLMSLAQKPEPKAEPEPQPESAEYVDKPFLPNGDINVEWYRKHDYDEGQIALAEAKAKDAKKLAEISQQFESLQGYLAEQHRDRDLNDFHDALDNLDGEFFGKTIAEGKAVVISEQLGRRRSDVFAQLDVAAESLARRLGHPPSMAQKVELAAQLAYGNELKAAAEKRSAAAKKGHLSRVAAQARKVRPVGSQAPAQGTHTPRVTSKEVLADPQMKALLAQIKEENASD